MTNDSPIIVSCPICNKDVPEKYINRHLDLQCEWIPHSSPPIKKESDADHGTNIPISEPSLPPNTESKMQIHPFFHKDRLSTSLISPRATAMSKRTTEPSSDRSTAASPMKRSFDMTLESSDVFCTPASIPTPTKNSESQSKRHQMSRKSLAELARPMTLQDFQGQEKLTGEGSILHSLVKQKKLPSLILWGPPGSGKTTLARILAKEMNCFYQELSATSCGIPELKKAAEKASRHSHLTGMKSIIFLDEIHRFSKAQQDFFLSPLEASEFILIAATTENPSFRVNSALLSRCQVFVLEKHQPKDLMRMLQRCVHIRNNPDSHEVSPIEVPDPVLEYIAQVADGDGRAAINTLEMSMDACISTSKHVLSIDDVKGNIQKQHILYDKDGEKHYNIISALHKSMRGSDENGALYWLGRMIYAGEDPLYVARRLVRFASEDVGLADNNALPLAMSTYQACHVIGMPECDCILAHCVVYLCRAPKSVESYKAMKMVKNVVHEYPAYPVPFHIRNAPTKLMKNLGYGEGYKYNPDYDYPVDQEYLPLDLPIRNFFDPRYATNKSE